MRNWQRWAIAAGLAFAVGFLQQFEEGSGLVDALRHGAHALLPALIGLKMTLNPEEK